MARYKVKGEAASAVSLDGVEYKVEHGAVEVPDDRPAALKAAALAGLEPEAEGR